MLDDTLLDDPERLSDADVEGLLRAVATAGAQVRATAETAAEVDLAGRLAGGRPRSLVLLRRPGAGDSAASLLHALIAPASPVPVVLADLVPGWVGALDVVVAHTDDSQDPEFASSLERAARFGATVVLSAPPDGPVASAVAGRAVLLPPRVTVPPGLTWATALTAGLLTANALGTPVGDVEALADLLDTEAGRCHPGQESFANPAKSLALRMADRVPLLWGLDETAVAVARHGAHALAAYAAVVADVSGYRQAMARPALRRAAVAGSRERDIFADPDDLSTEGPTPRVLLLSVRTGPVADTARHQAGEILTSADLLAPAEEISADEAGRAAVPALRLELAALYLGLAAGTIGGTGHAAPVTV